MKTIGREPDVTPICASATLRIITLIVCKIRTKRSNGECRLLYQYRQDFEHECDSRFTLMTKNQTVFLHLTSLTPVDSGNYTCECSHIRGTDILHLNITVKGKCLIFLLLRPCICLIPISMLLICIVSTAVRCRINQTFFNAQFGCKFKLKTCYIHSFIMPVDVKLTKTSKCQVRYYREQ